MAHPTMPRIKLSPPPSSTHAVTETPPRPNCACPACIPPYTDLIRRGASVACRGSCSRREGKGGGDRRGKIYVKARLEEKGDACSDEKGKQLWGCHGVVGSRPHSPSHLRYFHWDRPKPKPKSGGSCRLVIREGGVSILTLQKKILDPRLSAAPPFISSPSGLSASP